MKILYLHHQPEGPGDKEKEPTLRALVSSYASPGTEIDIGYPDDFEGARIIRAMGAQQVLTGLHHAVATAAIISKTVWAEQQGYDAVVQANHFDPGVEPARLAARIPVIGLFRTALHAAATLADRLGLLVPLDGHVPYVERMLRTYGMTNVVADIRPLGIYGSNMASRKDEIFSRAVELLKAMAADSRAECIVPLGAAIIPQVITPEELEREVGLPVLNTTAIGIRFAETCVGLAMSQSPVTYPAAKLRYEDFLARAN
jgi:allantoin racemase